MTAEQDFERAWQQKITHALQKVAGTSICAQVMEGGDGLSADSSPAEVGEWTRKAMERLTTLLDESKAREIMTGCSCQYPRAGLSEIRETYHESGDIGLALQMLQQKFESFLRDSMELSESLIADVVGRGWGLAGVRQGDVIVATKIPKSGYLVRYFEETDPERRRQLYCHCPRVRGLVTTSETIPQIYCYCGAGFYKDIWEEILQRPVEVEVLETVLSGGDVCRIAVHLPQGV